MNKKILVIGGGSWGTALAISLSEKKENTVYLYFRDRAYKMEIEHTRINRKYLPNVTIPESVRLTDDLMQDLDQMDLIVLAVSSQQCRSVLEQVKDTIKPSCVIVNVSKGLEKDTHLRISQISKEICPNNPYVVLSGPSHAEEVAIKMPTTLVASSEDARAQHLVQDVFRSSFLRIYSNSDVIGVELGGTVKNIIAFTIGMLDGLRFGDNSKAAIMTRGISEMARFGVAMGANVTTFSGLSGIGDLIVTCTSEHSRNRRAGYLLGSGATLEETLKQVGMVVEGVVATKVVHEIATEKNIEMPITNQLYRILYEGQSVAEAKEILMAREQKSEMEDEASFTFIKSGVCE